MLAALLLAMLPQQGWVVEDLPAPPDEVLLLVSDGPTLLAVGTAVHGLAAGASAWQRLAELPQGVGAPQLAAAGNGLLAVQFDAPRPGADLSLRLLDLTTQAWVAAPREGGVDATALAFLGDGLHAIGWAAGANAGQPRAAVLLASGTEAALRWWPLPWPGAAEAGDASTGGGAAAALQPALWPGVAVQGAGAAGEALYLMGGVGATGDAPALRSDAWRLGLASETWQRLPDLPEAEAYGPVAYRATELLLFGASAWSFNTVTGQWVDRGPSLLPRSPASTMVRWQDRIVQLTLEPDGAPPRLLALSLPKAEAALGAIDFAVVIGYLALLIGLGAWFSRREKSTEDYFLAGRRIPWWAAGLSLFATQLSAITFLGTPAVSYATDWMLLPSWLGILFFAPLAVKFFLPLYRKRPMRTVYTWLEWRYGLSVRLFGSASFMVFQLLRMGVVVYLPSLALSTATGLEVTHCILLMGVLATLYTVLGGMEAVVWTDVLQTGVLLLGVGATLWVVFAAVGDPSAAFSAALEAGKLRTFGGGWSTVEAATWSLLLGGLFLQFGPYTADQAMVQRYLSTKDERAAARGIWLNGWMSVPAGALFILVGTALWLYYRARPETLALGIEADAVFPLFLANELPTGVSGLVIAGLFAAAMSTLDSGMHAVATTLTTDWVERLGGREAPLKLARTLTVVAGVAATGIAVILAASGILSSLLFFLKALGLLTSGVAGVFLLGALSKRATAVGALCGAAAGISLLAWVAFGTDTYLFVYPLVGIPSTVVVGWLASRAGLGRAVAA